jgi:hypothetical protein
MVQLVKQLSSTVSFRLHPDARDELREAVVFYDRAAERFVNAVETAIAAIILKPDRFREFDPGVRTCRGSRKAAACKIAEDALKSRYGSEGIADVNYKEVSRYTGNIPMNLGNANFTASCRCRVWWI